MYKRLLLPLFVMVLLSTTIIPQIVTAYPIYKYNIENGKYHKLNCKWAVKCTKNCIEKKLSEIKKLEGIPCKTCKPKV